MEVYVLDKKEKSVFKDIAEIHVKTFKGFFLTFMGKGFLKVMYKSYFEFKDSGLILAKENNILIGFLAFSKNMSAFYKYMLKKHFFAFLFYSFLAFLRKPKVFFRLLRALNKSDETKRTENYVELSSIGVLPDYKGLGAGSLLIDKLKSIVDFNTFSYINLETDADNNDKVNVFYVKNGFILVDEYKTREGRRMNEYRFWVK